MADSTAGTGRLKRLDLGGSRNIDARQVTGAMLLNAFPALARRLTPVPRSHFATLDEEQRVVACPCRRRPVLALGELRSCEKARQWAPHHAPLGPCGRTFIATNRAVLVTGGKG